MTESNSNFTFDELKLHPQLLKGIHHLGFLRPTPIQEKAIPAILEGRDLIGCAQTGTGKTAAFVLPILHKLLQKPKQKNPRALILAPTRELALQSMDHLKALSQFVTLRGTAIFGGMPMRPQIQTLARGVDIISATPGRLLDHLQSGTLNLSQIEVLVLDEVDQMLDMGFLPDIQRIIRTLPTKRQTLVFSATLTNEISSLIHKILINPLTIQVGQHTSAAAGIRHAVYPVPHHLKTDLLLEILQGQGFDSVIVFTRTKNSADRLSRRLEREGLKVSILHGDRSQNQRLNALNLFRRRQSQILVATDIAARGIDVNDITHVINFDMPATPQTYVHRIGRTARKDTTGDAFTLMARDEEHLVRSIERVLKLSLPRVTLPDFDYKKAPPPKSSTSPHSHRREQPSPRREQTFSRNSQSRQRRPNRRD